MKRILTIFLVVLLASALFGCTQNQNTTGYSQNEDNHKIKIITTLFPQYDFARQIAGDRADVKLLLPPGTESHSFEPTPSDIITIANADVFVYTGKYMEPWAEKIIQSVGSDSIEVLDISKGITLAKGEHEHEEHEDAHHEEHEDHGHYHEYDPHIWTSPVIAKKMVENLAATLCFIDPENASYYKANADNYLIQLDELDAEITQIVNNGVRNKLYFGGRFALYYFTEEYGLGYKSAYDNCSSETEPSAYDIARIIDEIREHNIPVIYYQELTDPKVSRSISESTGVEMLLFHSCHNVSREEFDSGITYIDLMKLNAENLKKGLN